MADGIEVQDWLRPAEEDVARVQEWVITVLDPITDDDIWLDDDG